MNTPLSERNKLTAVEARGKPRRIIFGTDWWIDCDDIAVLDILSGVHKRGQIELQAICVSSVMRS